MIPKKLLPGYFHVTLVLMKRPDDNSYTNLARLFQKLVGILGGRPVQMLIIHQYTG